MNVRLAILFAAVAEERSFTRGAARLNIAQPWLSAQIRKFEEQLGFQLFHRAKGPIELTTEGQKMLPLAQELADTARRLRDLSRSIAHDVSLFVRVGAHASSAGVPEFASLNDEFTQKYRDTSLMVEAGVTAELIADVVNGRLDVALVMAPFEEPGLLTLLLREVTPYVLAPRESQLAAAELSPQSLAGQRLGVTRRAAQPEFYDAVHNPLLEAGADLRPVPEPGARAMEHFARSQRMGVLMVEGDAAAYREDPDLVARPAPFLKSARHMLVKRADLEKRAASRYWRAAETLVSGRQAN